MFDVIINNASSPDALLQKFPHAKVIPWQDPLTIAAETITEHYWVLDTRVDYANFDFTYEPTPWEKKQNHCWNTLTFLKTPGATDVNYKDTHSLRTLQTSEVFELDIATVDAITEFAKTAKTKHIWIINSNIDYSNFDFNYVPNTWQDKHLHVWPTEGSQFGDTFLVPAKEWLLHHPATVTSFPQINYNHETLHKLSRNAVKYPVIIMNVVDQQDNVTSLIKRLPHATVVEWKGSNIDTMSALDINEPTWIISSVIDYSNFDFSFVPDPWEQMYTHCWLTENNDFGDTFLVGADWDKAEVRYHASLGYVKTEEADHSFYDIFIMNMGGNDKNVAVIKEKYPTAKVVRWTDHFNTINRIVTQCTTPFAWVLSSNIDYTDFNINYRPGNWEDTHLHCWKTSGQIFGDTFLIPVKAWRERELNELIDYKPINYKKQMLQSLAPEDANFKFNDVVIMDQGNAQNLQTLKNRFPNAITVRFTDLFNTVRRAAEKVTTKYFWVLSSQIDYSEFNFAWRAAPWEEKQLHVWSTDGEEFGDTFYIPLAQWQEQVAGITRLVDFNKVNYTHPPLTRLQSTTNLLPDVFMLNIGGNDANVASLRGLFPSMQVLPYDDVKNALKHAAANSSTPFFWLISSNINYLTFDFNYRPNPWEEEQLHIWKTGDSEYGDTFYSSKTLPTDEHFHDALQKLPAETQFTRYDVVIVDRGRNPKNVASLLKRFPQAKVIKEGDLIPDISTKYFWVLSSVIDYSNFDFRWSPTPWQAEQVHAWAKVSKFGETFLIPQNFKDYLQLQAEYNWHEDVSTLAELKPEVANVSAYDMYMMNMGGHDISNMQAMFPNMHVSRWISNHFDTIKRIAKEAKTKYFWVLSSCMDYTDFDFTYQPEPWEAEQLHVWPSEDQEFGDTFLVPTALWEERCKEIAQLEDFGAVNYNHTPLPRKPWQIVEYIGDDMIDVINRVECETPYVLVKHVEEQVTVFNQPWLWYKRPVVALTPSHATSLVPRDVFGDKITQIYDYKHLEKDYVALSRPLDIIFISNGEPNAEENFQHLTTLAPNIKRVQNVKGRANSFYAMAEQAETDWFFVVTAKLKVSENFDWSWQPDYWQEPKHYIFYANNPVTGVAYGHMAMVAYNKNLVLSTVPSGLDFTMEKAHAVVPIVSGTAYFNDSPVMAWRTAFREVVKLMLYVTTTPTAEGKYRLRAWLTKSDGLNGEWSLRGAKDAEKYFEQTNGNIDLLKLSYEWEWLDNFFKSKYTL